ncbi:MAG: GNAT family N-acetyltransferase [Bryobacterales bacterium]|nr:GNAT family N-acetyltransferase [Bryobacterales bacterium]
MNQLWADFVRYAARQSKVGSMRASVGLEAAWVNSTLPFCNGTFLTAAPADAADLVRQLEAAKADAAPHALPWALFTYDPHFENLAIPAESGFARVMGVRVMTADIARLAAPRRPLPALDFRRVTDDTGARHALDLNMQAYGMPSEMTESVLATGAFFGDPSREFGFVGYANGTPVSTASAVLIDGWLYVALVATMPGHQKNGYAEAVMRHALQQAAKATNVTRTSLDATDAGAPLYAQMGYTETGETWGMWMLAH